MRTPRAGLCALAAALLVSCGGDSVVTGDAGASGGAAGTGGGAGDSGGTWDPDTYSAPKECWSLDESGEFPWQICGTEVCTPNTGYCRSCWDVDPGHATMCDSSNWGALFSGWLEYCSRGGDGALCFFDSEGRERGTIPFHFAQVLADAGEAELVRYGDYGLFTGEPLPAPAECVELPGVPTCGGFCGGCGAGELCRGRAPLHPYGVCAPAGRFWCTQGDRSCQADEACFSFLVEPAAQAVADERGNCMPLETCKAAAAALPGGGKCDAP